MIRERMDMKGIIIYSSSTGNTKRMAEYIGNIIGEQYELDVFHVEDSPKIDSYDFILLGGWINKGHIDSKAKKAWKKIKDKPLGLFATLGADPNSEHGQDMKKVLENLVKDHTSLGVYLCRGTIDPKLIKHLEGFSGKVIPKGLREKIIESGRKASEATEEELEEAARYFLKNIKELDESPPKDYE
ncbi:MAG: flavodoxin family protein [Tissierellia bacterium]|nr:flavodoxin family protein [Tissierellia bacterium]